MVGTLANLLASFVAGLLAPIGAVCVLPLYPGYLAYLAGQVGENKSKWIFIKLGLVVTAGVIISMFLFGLIFTKLLQKSLTTAIGIISPIAFGILAIVSIFLIFNVDIGRLIPRIKSPKAKNPYVTSFLFGFFFGLIVLPCNPASLIILFAISTSTIGFLANLMNFVVFGVGMAAPLLIFSIISASKSTEIIGFLTKHKRLINLITGILMLVLALYFLFFDFDLLQIQGRL